MESLRDYFKDADSVDAVAVIFFTVWFIAFVVIFAIGVFS